MRPTLTFFAFLMSVLAHSQPNRPALSFVGKVVDSTTEMPISFASVAVMAPQDSAIVTGALADAEGAFRIEQLAQGTYQIQVSFMGYASWTSEVSVTPGPPVRLGTIRLEPAIAMLEEAVVVEQQSSLEMMIDRRVFNVGSDLTNTGANASELLTNVPSVSVDIDGNIFLRGSSNVQVLIDGRPSGLTGAAGNAFLQQLPASSIERVEVITNPSARYDPDGMAGILNIILKKEKRSGFNGSTQISVGNNRNLDANFSLNQRTARHNLYTSLGYGTRNRWTSRTSHREQSVLDDLSILDQTRTGSDVNNGLTGSIGGDWFPREGTTLSLRLSGRFNTESDYDTLFNAESWTSGLEVETQRFAEELEEGAGYDADLTYERQFNDDRNHKLTVALRASDSWGDNHEDLAESTLHLDSALTVTDVNDQHDERQRTVFSIDYERPLAHEGRLEWGWKSNVSLSTNAFSYLAVDSLTYQEGLYIPWNARPAAYDFSYREAVHAAYGTWGRKVGVWGISAGLRLEQVFTDAKVDDGITPNFENDYFSIYPSFNLSRQRNDENTWIASYSRRVNRPRGRQVDPFLNDGDPRNIRQGNPNLLPEYTHSLEFGHQWSRGGTSITTSLFYKHTDNVIRWYRTVDSLGIATSTYINLASRHDEGLEVIAMTRWGQSGSLRLTGSVYHLANDAGDAEAASDASGWSGSLNGFASWTFGAHWKGQINGMFRAPSITPQGRFNGYKYLDLAVSRTFLDQALTATCRVSDVFDTRQWSYTSSGPNFDIENLHKRQSRFVYLSLQWRFGQTDNRRSRSGRGNFGGMDGGGMEF